MSGPLHEIGIEEGDTTPLRGITAPQEGDNYITSYHSILRTLEQHTVYLGETQADLPDEDDVDWPLVGIAQTEADESDGDSVHVYDGSEWADTLQTAIEAVDTGSNTSGDETLGSVSISDTLYVDTISDTISEYAYEMDVVDGNDEMIYIPVDDIEGDTVVHATADIGSAGFGTSTDNLQGRLTEEGGVLFFISVADHDPTVTIYSK